MRILLLLSYVFLLSVSSCDKDKLLLTADKYYNKAYGTDTRHKMDVYLPVGHDSTTAMVILIHGGGWVAGSKADWSNEVINTIMSKGYGVACMNYRYAGGDYRLQMEDIQMAINCIDSNSAVWKTGKQKYALIGGSAGGHLALLYGHAFDSTHAVKAVVSLVGPTDLTDPVFHLYAANYGIYYVFEQFLGASYFTNPQVYADASPLFRFSNVPSLFIHGANDDLVPPAQGQRMFDSLSVHGIPADTTFFGNAGHDVFGPNQVNKQQVYNEVNQWLQTYLK